MNKKRKIILLVLSTLTLSLIAVGFLWEQRRSSPSPESYIRDGVNYAPPTTNDKKLNDSMKQDAKNEQTAETDSPQSESLKAVQPVISAWGQPAGHGTDLAINGYVPSVIETDGLCTISLRKDGSEVTVSKTALRNAQDTSCGQLQIAYSRLSPGLWKATLSYKSSTSIGSSVPTDIEVK